MVKYVDIPATMQVIGGVFLNNNLLDDEKYKFSEEDFSEEFHKILFGSIYNLHIQGSKEITAVDIEQYLEKRPKAFGVYKMNKGTEYLQRLSDITQLATFDYYYKRVKKMTLLRMYQKVAGMDLTWLYNPDEILNIKKKEAQENWFDNTPIEDIADLIDKKVESIKLKYVNGVTDTVTQAGTGLESFIESLKLSPEYGYPMYGPYINTITRGARLKKVYLRSAATGTGKAIPNYTLIPTPSGYRTVGEIKVGDYLFGQNGVPTKVTAIHPQPEEKEIWKITFADGRVAECCGEHLWEYRYQSHRGYGYRVEDTQTIYERAQKLKNGFKDSCNRGYRFHIRLNEEVQYPEKEYSVPPYAMGALLGDGSFRYASSNKALTFSSADEELPKRISEYLNCTYQKSSDFNYSYTFKPSDNLKHNIWVEELLVQYPDLWNKKSEDKFIPSEYLIGSVGQRWELLRGLMDTDGSIDEKGRTNFTTISKKLADNVIELVRSLGMTASITEDKREEKYTTGICYTVHIQCKKALKPKMFSLSRKVNRAIAYAESQKREEYKDHLAIISIEKTTEKAAMTCFTVENDNHLFLMNDYLVTHNTRSMVADACAFSCSEIYDEERKQWIENPVSSPTLFIATEQDLNEIQTMLLAFVADVDEEHILTGKYEGDEWERIKKAISIVEKAPLYIEELPDFSMQDIESLIKKSINDYGVKTVMFDYLHSSMKILSEVSSKAGVKGLREDNVLFMISVKLKDIANEYGIFILTATQLNGTYVDSTEHDQNMLRGSKAIADKVDVGMLMVKVSKADLDALQPLLDKGYAAPDIRLSVYKNRRGRYEHIILWCRSKLSTCRIIPMYVTDYNYELIEMKDTKITVEPRSAF